MARRKAVRRFRRASSRERAAFHEAGHVVGWLSTPFSPPDIYGVTIERDRRRALTGEVRHRPSPRHDARFLRLEIGRALARGKITVLAPALAELSAQVRAHAAGPVAEAMRIGAPLRTIEEGECDYWNAYELCATVDLEPDEVWRAEATRARHWLRRHWERVQHLATLLLRQPPGRRTLAGAALRGVVRQAAKSTESPYDTAYYEAQARDWLARHRAHWGRRPHWTVMELRRRRRISVAWASDASSAASIAAELTRYTGEPLEVRRQRRRR